MPRPNKKPKPTFDVARDPVIEPRSGWVYRSAPAADESRDRREFSEFRQPVQPQGPPPADESWFADGGWVATGVYWMMFPVTLGMSIMFAPVNWLLGGRPRR